MRTWMWTEIRRSSRAGLLLDAELMCNEEDNELKHQAGQGAHKAHRVMLWVNQRSWQLRMQEHRPNRIALRKVRTDTLIQCAIGRSPDIESGGQLRKPIDLLWNVDRSWTAPLRLQAVSRGWMESRKQWTRDPRRRETNGQPVAHRRLNVFVWRF